MERDTLSYGAINSSFSGPVTAVDDYEAAAMATTGSRDEPEKKRRRHGSCSSLRQSGALAETRAETQAETRVYDAETVRELQLPDQVQWHASLASMLSTADEVQGHAHEKLLVAWDINPKTAAKAYAVFENREDAAVKHALLRDVMRHPIERRCGYEIIRTGAACLVFFDVEWRVSEKMDASTRCLPEIDTEHRTVSTLLACVNRYMRRHIEDFYGECEFVVLCGSRRVGQSYKNSYHVVVRNVFAENTAVLKSVFGSGGLFWQQQDVPRFLEKIVDPSVYSKNRCFRLAQHTKKKAAPAAASKASARPESATALVRVSTDRLKACVDSPLSVTDAYADPMSADGFFPTLVTQFDRKCPGMFQLVATRIAADTETVFAPTKDDYRKAKRNKQSLVSATGGFQSKSMCIDAVPTGTTAAEYAEFSMGKLLSMAKVVLQTKSSAFAQRDVWLKLIFATCRFAGLQNVSSMSVEWETVLHFLDTVSKASPGYTGRSSVLEKVLDWRTKFNADRKMVGFTKMLEISREQPAPFFLGTCTNAFKEPCFDMKHHAASAAADVEAALLLHQKFFRVLREIDLEQSWDWICFCAFHVLCGQAWRDFPAFCVEQLGFSNAAETVYDNMQECSVCRQAFAAFLTEMQV